MLRSLSPWRERTLTPSQDRFTRSLTRFEEEMEDLMQRMFGNEAFLPSVDVAETDQDFVFSMDLPGMAAEDVNVEVQDGDLWITGERKEETKEEGKTFHRMERRYGQFRRVFPMPKIVDEDHIRADFKDGVLKVHVPKKEESKPKHIEVNQ